MKSFMKQITKNTIKVSKNFNKIKVPKRNFTKVARNFAKSLKVSNALKFRNFSTQSSSYSYKTAFLVGASTIVAAGMILGQVEAAENVDYDAVREDIETIIDSAIDTEPMYDDGSYGPVLVRLAWHASGTYSKNDKTGGSAGGTIRFKPESAHGANAGLHVARNLLEPLKEKYPGISYADLYTLAGAVAIEALGGPKIKWRPGRSDVPSENDVKPTPDDRLPDASKEQGHLRNIFYRMGFNDQEIVALAGAHALGRCHSNRSGYSGPWTRSPTSFTNAYFQELIDNKWTVKKWNGPMQYEDPTGELMMLPADLALIQDDSFKRYVEIYASDQQKFFNDFAAAFEKLLELGVKFPSKGGKGNGATWRKLL